MYLWYTGFFPLGVLFVVLFLVCFKNYFFFSSFSPIYDIRRLAFHSNYSLLWMVVLKPKKSGAYHVTRFIISFRLDFIQFYLLWWPLTHTQPHSTDWKARVIVDGKEIENALSDCVISFKKTIGIHFTSNDMCVSLSQDSIPGNPTVIIDFRSILFGSFVVDDVFFLHFFLFIFPKKSRRTEINKKKLFILWNCLSV